MDGADSQDSLSCCVDDGQVNNGPVQREEEEEEEEEEEGAEGQTGGYQRDKIDTGQKSKGEFISWF